MRVTAWILFVFFILMGGNDILAYVFKRGGISITRLLLMIFSIIMVAFSAGVIFGGLFQ